MEQMSRNKQHQKTRSPRETVDMKSVLHANWNPDVNPSGVPSEHHSFTHSFMHAFTNYWQRASCILSTILKYIHEQKAQRPWHHKFFYWRREDNKQISAPHNLRAWEGLRTINLGKRTESDRGLEKASLSKPGLSKFLNEVSEPFTHAGEALPRKTFFDGVVLGMTRAASSYPLPHSNSCPPERFHCAEGLSITLHSQFPDLWLSKICFSSSLPLLGCLWNPEL